MKRFFNSKETSKETAIIPLGTSIHGVLEVDGNVEIWGTVGLVDKYFLPSAYTEDTDSAKQKSQETLVIKATGTVTIHPEARVYGSIQASEVLVMGLVNGAVSAYRTVELTAKGSVYSISPLSADSELTVTIGTGVKMTGSVTAKNLNVNGSVSGDIAVTDTLKVGKTGQVLSGGKAGNLISEQGAVVKGSFELGTLSEDKSTSSTDYEFDDSATLA